MSSPSTSRDPNTPVAMPEPTTASSTADPAAEESRNTTSPTTTPPHPYPLQGRRDPRPVAVARTNGSMFPPWFFMGPREAPTPPTTSPVGHDHQNSMSLGTQALASGLSAQGARSNHNVLQPKAMNSTRLGAPPAPNPFHETGGKGSKKSQHFTIFVDAEDRVEEDDEDAKKGKD